jgi:hypothetical protein
LPLRSGDRLTVEGWLPASAPVPTLLTLEVTGVTRVERAIADHEPFRAELVLPELAIADQLRTVVIVFPSTSVPAGSFAAIITGAGVR